jgi:hypothetical protein
MIWLEASAPSPLKAEVKLYPRMIRRISSLDEVAISLELTQFARHRHSLHDLCCVH